MIHRTTFSFLIALALCSETAVAEKLNDPPKGFTALFSGSDFTGWKLNDKNAAHWKIEDGVIHYDGKGSSLPTEKDYGNFCLYVDWKIEKGADSGIYLRGAPQVQIWTRPEGSGGLWNNKKAGHKPLVAADNPPGEWNTFQIEMIGDNVTVHLNGKLVVDNVPLETHKGRATGPILLQHHGNPLWFRNIFIKELPASESAE